MHYRDRRIAGPAQAPGMHLILRNEERHAGISLAPVAAQTLGICGTRVVESGHWRPNESWRWEAHMTSIEQLHEAVASLGLTAVGLRNRWVQPGRLSCENGAGDDSTRDVQL